MIIYHNCCIKLVPLVNSYMMHGRTYLKFCVVLRIVCFVSFCVLFVCKCVLYNCHRVATHLQLTNISYYIITLRFYVVCISWIIKCLTFSCLNCHHTRFLLRYVNVHVTQFLYLYYEPTNAQLINNLLYCSLLHCPYMFRRYCVIFWELVLSTC